MSLSATYQRQQQAVRLPSLVLGTLVGLFVQLSSLGANFCVVVVLGSGLAEKTDAQILEFSSIWSICASIMAIITLVCIRYLIHGVLSNDNHNNTKSTEIIDYVEMRFAAGCMIGLSLTWLGTDFAMGMPPQLRHSTIGVLLFLGLYLAIEPCSRCSTKPPSSACSPSTKAMRTGEDLYAPLL